MADYPDPAYDLSELQGKARVGFVHFRAEALDGAAELEFSRHDIVECVCQLTSAEFHKSMDAENPRWTGCRQDVYKPMFEGVELYVKVQLWPGKRLYIVSFKKKYL